MTNVQKANNIAKEYGLQGSQNRPYWGNVVLIAVISKANAGSGLGVASGMLVRLNNNDAVTVGHEVAHTFGLADNYPNVNNELMDYPPSELSPIELDEICGKCLDK